MNGWKIERITALKKTNDRVDNMGRKSNFSNIIIAPRSLDLTVYFVLGICLLIPGPI